VEPASCPSLTRGKFAYDFCDTGKVCPLAKMYTLGSGFIPSPNHAGGLRYHGMSPILSQLYHDGYMEARSVEQTRSSQPPRNLPASRASCPRRNPATPSRSPWTRP
jgi:predicted alternative tryptophan synthase beta-subunit